MKTKLIPLFLLICFSALAQQQTFDLSSYRSPIGWEKQTTETAIQFSKQDAKSGAYCIITLMKAIPGSGNSKENFDLAWKTVVKEMVTVNTNPQMQPVSKKNGWDAQSGYAPFESEGTNGIAILITSSGFQRMINILILTNTDVYQKEMETFLGSVNFSKPADALDDNTLPNTQLQTKPVTNTGITYSTINWDDGWTSTIQNDWVLVSKGSTKIYLLYAVPYDSRNFSGTGVMERDYYWDNYVSKYFTIQTKQYKDNGEFIGSLKPNYVEGWAKDKQSGNRVFIAMTLSIAPNTAYLTISATPDEATLRRTFPKANDSYVSDLAAMSRYNKFSVTVNDIIGTWQNGNTSTLQWYYVYPSGYESYAGMTVAASSATFSFDGNGSYTSIQNGATGAVGNMGTFQQNYKGKYSVTNWAITATNRWQGKTAKFDASFMAIRGGRILVMNDNAGSAYQLVKTK